MKSILFVALALVFTVGAVQAAEISTKAGTKALVFEFNGLSTLGLNPYNGGIALRYYLSDGLAIRPGVQFGWNQNTVKPTSGNLKNTTTSVGVNAVLEKHLTGPTSVSPYLGVGASVGYRKVKNEYPASNPADQNTTSVGVMGVAGFEWGWTESVTLGGEYTLGFNYSSSKDKLHTGSDSSSMGIAIDSATLALSVTW